MVEIKIFYLFSILAFLGIASCNVEEKFDGKDFEFSVQSNLPEDGLVPCEGGNVVFTVESDGEWIYDLDLSRTDWLSDVTLDGNTLAIIVEENLVSAPRSVEVKFISVYDTTLTKNVILTQAGAPEVPAPEPPKADLLDVVFNSDGTAEDLSPLKNEIRYFPGSNLSFYYHEGYERIVSSFKNTPGVGAKDSYYRVDYYENETFKTGLDDGHTLEVVFRSDRNDDGKEYKPFSAHQGGGTGFLITKDGYAGKPADITFLPNVSETGGSKWVWARSGVYPEIGRYYHVVGVYDKDAEKAYVYVDGEQKAVVDAPGNLRHASTGAQWFAIGGDAAPNNVGNAWNGSVALARVYNNPLTAEEVAMLYNEVTFPEQSPVEFNITDLSYLPKCEIASGYKYIIYGNGFNNNDKVRLTSTSDINTSLNLDASLAANLESISIKVPSALPSGKSKYFMTLVRGTCQYSLGVVEFNITDNPKAAFPKIIAHRGQHTDGVENSTENSMAALINAQKLDIYGVEFDVWVTTDDVVVVNHNATVSGSSLRIDASEYSQIKNLTLSNGEKLPTFEDYLVQGAKDPDTKLVCEIKTHSSAGLNTRAVNAVVAAVKAKGMDAQVDYIAFDYDICKQLIAAMPSAEVQYLGGDKEPSVVAADKLTGIDYSYSGAISKDPGLVDKAHALGLEVNTWTINSAADMMACVALGVDYITTDKPASLKTIFDKPFVSKP